jgi:hypothetical protein
VASICIFAKTHNNTKKPSNETYHDKIMQNLENQPTDKIKDNIPQKPTEPESDRHPTIVTIDPQRIDQILNP